MHIFETLRAEYFHLMRNIYQVCKEIFSLAKVWKSDFKVSSTKNASQNPYERTIATYNSQGIRYVSVQMTTYVFG